MYRPSFFAAVMATGIVGLAVRDAGSWAVAWVLAALAAVAYVVLVALHVRERWVPTSRGDAVQLFAFVAATEVLASLSTWHTVSVVLWCVGVAAWVAIAAVVVRAPLQADVVRPSWLLAPVATSSLAVSGAPIARRLHSDVLLAICAACWLLGLVLYAMVIALIARRRSLEFNDFQGEHWVAMGALAIATLAGSRVLACITALRWGPHDVADTLTVVVWVVALCWLPALVAVEGWRLRRPPLYTSGRWSSVFPLGMLAVASHALWLTAGGRPQHVVFAVFVPLAAAAWVATAAGFLTLASARDRPHAL
ncbi:MAG TPA: hypothetical protein VF032_11310 [Thermoleophilaceae bacterium]